MNSFCVRLCVLFARKCTLAGIAESCSHMPAWNMCVIDSWNECSASSQLHMRFVIFSFSLGRCKRVLTSNRSHHETFLFFFVVNVVDIIIATNNLHISLSSISVDRIHFIRPSTDNVVINIIICPFSANILKYFLPKLTRFIPFTEIGHRPTLMCSCGLRWREWANAVSRACRLV